MSNLQLRVISAIFLAILVLGLTWFGGLPFRVLAVAIGALVFLEWSTITGIRRDQRFVTILWVLLAIPLLALMAGFSAIAVLASAVVVTLLAVFVGWTSQQGPSGALGVAYAAIPACALAFLRDGDQSGLHAMLYLFGVVWATDILAYFTGRAIGGPKLAPSISPGKTWSGAIGGAVGAVVVGMIIAYLAGQPALFMLGFLALLLSAVSQAGDLFESAVKRRYGAKDSGNLIPGHGGVMDRVDGLVAAAFALYLAGWFIAGADSPASGLFPL